MSDNNIELKSISELLGMKFFIPSYQRGYRWTNQQVKDLLNDVNEFDKTKGFYCIQPLVVKKKEEDILQKIKEAKSVQEVESLLKGTWEVIDGQQRLTSIYIILSYLAYQEKYTIEYQTRNEFVEFLTKLKKGESFNELKEKKEYDNIDFYHISNTYTTITEWFENKDKLNFLSKLLNNVRFIWYESTDEDPIQVFRRLNSGKIGLTNAELIKALFLNRSNFGNANIEHLKLRQQEIASEWDRIEYTLQNDEFWLFIHDPNYKNPTRIDFIFDLICEQETLGKFENIGNDEYKTFRYFYEYFQKEKENTDAKWLLKTWRKIKKYYQIFEEWYNDLELYHYVGYLVENKHPLASLLNNYYQDKSSFLSYLKKEITDKISKCKDLSRNYGENGESKVQCRPLLLLLNIQTVINQNKELVNSEKYGGLGAFYKFPFHLFKKESHKKNGKGWEVEHIASNSGDNFEKEENQRMWLAAVAFSLEDGELKKEIQSYLDEEVDCKDFNTLLSKVKELDINPLEEMEKQKIWNFALLDSTTNEQYQNDPFPIKRICVLSKEQGEKSKFVYDKTSHRVSLVKTKDIAFVPLCTKMVFTKAYTDIPKSLSAWTRQDAEAYLKNIEQVLMEFIYPDIFAIPKEKRPALDSRIICHIPEDVLKRYVLFIKKTN